MRILIYTVGSHGDVHPFLAIGRRLAQQGADVTLFAHPYFRDDTLAAGLDWAPLGADLDILEVMRNPQLMHQRRGGRVVFDLIFRTAPEVAATLRQQIETLRPDAVLTHHICLGAQWVCQQMQVPCAVAVLAPLMWFSRQDPVPLLQRRPGKVGRLTAVALTRPVIAATKRTFNPRINTLRTSLGFHQLPDALRNEFHSGTINLGMWSPHFRDRLPDDPDRGIICGFPWHDRSHASQALAPEVESFLGAGEPPIVFSLGTAAVHSPGRFYHDCIDAAVKLRRRAILLTGHPENTPPNLPRGIAAFSYVPFSLLLPRAAVSVHHGGIGTTGQALRSGRPSVIIPHAHDQFHNALHAHRLGAGLALPRTSFRARTLAPMLDRALHDQDIARNAARLGELLAREDGAARAAQEIGRIAGRAPARQAAMA